MNFLSVACNYFFSINQQVVYNSFLLMFSILKIEVVP